MSRTRLERLERYLKEAEANPEDNKLYIEDLKVSIECAKLTPNQTYSDYAIQNGFKNED